MYWLQENEIAELPSWMAEFYGTLRLLSLELPSRFTETSGFRYDWDQEIDCVSHFVSFELEPLDSTAPGFYIMIFDAPEGCSCGVFQGAISNKVHVEIESFFHPAYTKNGGSIDVSHQWQEDRIDEIIGRMIDWFARWRDGTITLEIKEEYGRAVSWRVMQNDIQVAFRRRNSLGQVFRKLFGISCLPQTRQLRLRGDEFRRMPTANS